MNEKKQILPCVRIVISNILLIVLLFSGIRAMDVRAADTAGKTREINIVYDDSGSMFEDTYWSEAKYAVEVFAAMMGSEDTINIYQMSDYNNPLVLKGSKDVDSNVRQVSNLNGESSTPFGAVLSAADNLMLSDADDKWLVVFTDGWFDGDDDAADWENTLLGYVGQNNVKVVFATIGYENPLRNEKREGFYPYQAGYDPDMGRSTILERMTEIAARVFNYQSISLSGVGSGTVSFDADVPLSKIIAFAQGGGSGIGEVLVDGSPLENFTERSAVVKVDKNTKVPAGESIEKLSIAPDLNGIVYSASAKDENSPFPGGNYSFTCKTDNVQVFVEPGVLVEATLRNDAGESIDLENSSSGSISEGEWTVDVQMVDPLTGQKVDPSKSDILRGARTDVVVKTDDGEAMEYENGDVISVSGKKLELYGRTQYQGISGFIEKTSKIHKFKIDKSSLRFAFSSPGGYELDAVMLTPFQDMTFTVTVGSTPLTPEQTEKLKLKAKDAQGIQWKIEQVDDTGTFRLIPGYASRKGLEGVIPGEADLEVTGTLKTKGEKREGSGKVRINIRTDSEAGLILALQMPEEQAFDANGTYKYMFDSRIRGVPENGEEKPFILVRVQVKDIDGTVRQMSDEEWSKGRDRFAFKAESVNPKFKWRLIRALTLGGQSLSFQAVQGTEPSTYKLYLTGLSELNVLPNTSDLQVLLELDQENGAVYRGSETGMVTVKPVSWWKYIIYLLVISAILVIFILILIRELTKPRIPRDFKPEIVVLKSLAGTPQTPIQPRHFARFRRRNRWSLTKPEMCAVRFDSRDANKTINFTVVAIGNGVFRLADHQLFNFQPVRNTVRFKHRMTYTDMEKNPETEFETGDKIEYTRIAGASECRVTLTF